MSACPNARILSSRSHCKKLIGLISLTGLLILLYLWQLGREMSPQEIMEELVTEKDRSVRVTSPHIYLGKHGGRKKMHSRPWRVLCWITTYPGNFQAKSISKMFKDIG